MTQQEDDASSITTAKLKKKKNHICEMRHNQDFKIYKQYHTSRCEIWLYINHANIQPYLTSMCMILCLYNSL